MSLEIVAPAQSNKEIAAWAMEHLKRVVAIDSASDERSETIPSTPGQADLAADVGHFFAGLGATIRHDAHSNIIASFPGRGRGVGQRPVAMMVHLDTARGTAAVDELHVVQAWDGSRVPYPRNTDLCVDGMTYPDARAFIGHDLVHGPGDAPFGLDDKLGLTHMMTLARLLAANPDVEHPPLLLIGRPDEEVGRMAAVVGLAAMLASEGVDFGYTVDGILPYEVNLENFNASHAVVRFEAAPAPGEGAALQRRFAVDFGGVNTHGCTAKAEGYRAATRFAAEVLQTLVARGVAPRAVWPLRFVSDDLRDCDATVLFLVQGVDEAALEAAEEALRDAVATVVEPHLRRGASARVYGVEEAAGDADAAGAVWNMLQYVAALLGDRPGFAVAAEDSEGHDGYSNPYRASTSGAQCLLDVRLRDFDQGGLAARERHVRSMVSQGCAAKVEVTQQYVNMAPRLADREELARWPQAAARAIGIDAPRLPIRGGTGVDPFLDQGVPIANLGTGYFAPESEKEFTSLQHMATHAKWLFALVQVIAASRS